MQLNQATVMWAFLSSIVVFLSCVSPKKDVINVAAVPVKTTSLLKRSSEHKREPISDKTFTNQCKYRQFISELHSWKLLTPEK